MIAPCPRDFSPLAKREAATLFPRGRSSPKGDSIRKFIQVPDARYTQEVHKLRFPDAILTPLPLARCLARAGGLIEERLALLLLLITRNHRGDRGFLVWPKAKTHGPPVMPKK
jgi:hypothetical protein